MTVREHLELACTCVGSSVSATLDRADDYGLGAWLDHETHELSTGNARKTWLLMCSTGDAELLMLDEPFNGLDHDAAEALLAEIADWRTTSAVVLIAHHLPDSLAPDAVVDLASAQPDRRTSSTDEDPAP